jgi:uncharacterized cupin superfamily protein/RimJ/RimL family protein N-acetyltransferase
MRTRPVRADELDLFVEAGGHPDHREEVRQYLRSMLAAGSMRPEWCFVAEVEKQCVGRAALWALPGMDEPLALVLLDVPWEDDHLTVGNQLLDDVLAHARVLGAEEIEHVLDAPPMSPQFQDYPQRRAELLEATGFVLRRETDRFEWRGEEPPAVPTRLIFRTLEEEGEEEFVGAIERISEDTLDGQIRGDRERLGAEQAARGFFDDARKMAHEPSWWRLAYDVPDGELVGLVMPAEAPAFLTVFYVGVVPEMRGQGYVDDLLAAGTATLLEARRREGNEKPLRADTDVANAPMAAAFERARWVRFARRREYVVSLAPTPGRSVRHTSQDHEEDPKGDPEKDARTAERGGVVNMHEVPEEEWQEGRFGGREQDLGRAAGSVRVGLRREVITPGKQSSPRHAHMTEEEIFIVLRGRGTLLRGEEHVAVGPGDVVAFPAGTGVVHAFVADPEEELEFLSVGERKGNEVVVYPDSGKLLVAGIVDEEGRRYSTVGRLHEADYFDGEL